MPDAERAQSRERTLIQEMRQVLGRMEAALAMIRDSLVITTADGHILWCNQSFERLAASSKLQLLGRPMAATLPLDAQGQPLLPSDLRELGASAVSSRTVLLSQEPLRALELEWHAFEADRSNPLIFWIRDITDQVSNETLKRRIDLAERLRTESEIRNTRLQEEQLTLAAKVVECPVTGLPNRRGLQRRMTEALAILKDQPGVISILFCDLNGFKEINDLYGHHVGDDLLVEIGQRLQSALRPGDMLSRLGGDEFVVLTRSTTVSSDPFRLARRLQRRLQMPWIVEDQAIRPSMSVGIASTDDPAMTPEELLRRADLAMYDAKASDALSISSYDASIDTKVKHTIVLRRRVRQAIDNGELALVFQPIVNLHNGETVGQESLVRIHTPQAPVLSPDEFIPLAERTGMILPVGRWVISEALAHQRWLQDRDQPLLTSINVSPLQLKQEGFADWFLLQASHHGVDLCRTAVEVTEGMFIEQLEHTSHELGRLRSAGVQVYLDDFGTGFSSMSSLAELPIDAVKIDRSFIADFLIDPRKAKVLQSMIALAQDLSLTVIAEGIETESQHQGLLAMGCGLGQGYWFGRPEPAALGPSSSPDGPRARAANASDLAVQA